jgi:nucleotide-binding universal stress UspA family protein
VPHRAGFDAPLTAQGCGEPGTNLGHEVLERLFGILKTELESTRQLALESGASRVDTRLLQGMVAGEIVEFARQGEFDLIVMGTHGRTGMMHLIIGSIAERVLRLAPCPVLTVKQTATASASAAVR